MSTTQLYRESKLGDTLVDALEDLINAGKITPTLAMRILDQFDQSACHTLEAETAARTTFKGTLKTYRFCDNVWTFEVADAMFRTAGPSAAQSTIDVHCEKVKIVAVDAKLVSV